MPRRRRILQLATLAVASALVALLLAVGFLAWRERQPLVLTHAPPPDLPAPLAVAFSPDGLTLASGSGTGLRLWSLEAGALLLDLPEPCHSVAFSPDGSLLATVHENWVFLRSASSGAVLSRIYEFDVASATFSPDGRTMATIDKRSIAMIRSVPEGKGLLLWSSPLCYFPARDAFASTAQDGTELEVRSLAGRTLLRIPCADARDVRWLAISKDGATLVAACAKGMVHLWDARSGAPIRRVTLPKIVAFALSPNGELLATARRLGCLELWNAADGSVSRRIEHDRGLVSALTFSPAGDRLAVAFEDGTIRIWRVTGLFHR